MMHLRQLLPITILSICIVSCLIACVSSPNKPNVASNQNVTAKVNPAKNIDAIEYLEFAETYSNLLPEMQKQILNTSNQALVLNKNDLMHRMKLVMIYGLPSSSLLDTVKAQNLLQQVLQEDILSNSQLAYAHVLFDYLVLINKSPKNNGDEQKRGDGLQQKNEALQLKLEAAQQKLEASQQKLEASQQKLDELKKIEKSMGERDSKPK
jgi:hypothetical protein